MQREPSLYSTNIFTDFFVDPSETSDIAQSVTQEAFHLYFVPAFFGLQAPINDPNAVAGFVGKNYLTIYR